MAPVPVSCPPLTMKKSDIIPRLSKQPSSIWIMRQKPGSSFNIKPHHFQRDPQGDPCHPPLHTSCGSLLLGEWFEQRAPFRVGKNHTEDSTSLRCFCLSTNIYMHMKTQTSHILKFLDNQKYLLSEQDTVSPFSLLSRGKTGWPFPLGSTS